MKRQAALAFALLLAACAAQQAAPPQPRFDAPARFVEGGAWQRAAGSAATPRPDWWTSFGDPLLDDLEQQLAIGNENLKTAAAQVASAAAVARASQAALWPTLSFNADAERTPRRFDLTADAAWELDVWGRLSRGAEAAGASADASRDDLASATLSAQATLAQSYFALRAAEAQRALLERTAAADQRAVELTQARHDSGVVAQADVLQAQTQLSTVRSQIHEAVLQRAQIAHAIAVLLGRAPEGLRLEPSAALPEPPALPELLPSTLLETRPDIAAAERRVAAAYAQIGAADAAWFPSIELAASAGPGATSLARLVSAPAWAWTIGANVAQAVFDGGARRLASEQARAAAEQAGASYRQAVLTALQEVEDNLAALRELGDEQARQREALSTAQRTLEITQDQYRAGTVSYLNVVSAQTSVLAAEASVLQLQNRRLAAAVQLLKNLGGGLPTMAATPRGSP